MTNLFARYSLALLCAFGISLIFSLLSYFLTCQPNAPLVFDLYSGFGELTEQLVKHHSYQSANSFWTAHRMPFVPFFLAFLALFSHQSLFALIIKNMLFFSLTAIAILNVTKHTTEKKHNVIILFFVAYLCCFPHYMLYATMVDYEEGYLIHLFALLFIGLSFFNEPQKLPSTFRCCLFAVTNTIIYLTKSSMLPSSLFMCLAFFLRFNRSKKVFGIMIGVLLFGIVGWGTTNLVNSGTFSISSSWNGENFYKGNNKYALSFYPKNNLDNLHALKLLVLPESYDNEWQANRALADKALTYLKKNPADAIKLLLKKTWVCFFDIRKLPIHYIIEDKNYKSASNPLINRVSAFGMLLFRLLFFLSLYHTVVNFRLWITKKKYTQIIITLCFWGWVIMYTLPYIVGFVYTRHVVPLIIPTFYYALYLFTNTNHRIKNNI